MLEINGGFGEGGGQIVRTACTFSAVTGQAFRLFNVRANRSKPGLRAQHVTAIEAAASLVDAETRGVAEHSVQFTFTPRSQAACGDYGFGIRTAGSAGLVLQTVFPILALTDRLSRVEINGGTSVPFAPPGIYLEHVFGSASTQIGWGGTITEPEVGFAPIGGGLIWSLVGSADPREIHLDASQPSETEWIWRSSGIPAHVAEKASRLIADQFGQTLKVENAKAESSGGVLACIAPGSEGALPAGFTALAERGRPMEKLIANVARQLQEWRSKGGLDPHLADQLVPLLALTPGNHSFVASEVTDHLETVLELIPIFSLGTFELNRETREVRIHSTRMS